jgi:3-oxoadipate CoA-transferase, alpha subunit
LAREKVYASPETAVADIASGSVLLISGFNGQGFPSGLLRALSRRGIANLICVFSPGVQTDDFCCKEMADLVGDGQVSKIVSPLPFPPGNGGVIEERWRAGRLELEIVPQGTLAERLRAGGAGLGGVFIPTGTGTRFAQGKESRQFDGQECLLELPLRADFALLRAHAADTLGNAIYLGTGRNWGPTMALAAGISIAEVDHICQPGQLDPERIVTPGIFINRVVQAVSE